MKQIYYGQLDLTKLGKIARQHPELVKEVDFKDGKHKLVNIPVLDKEREDNFGNTACVKVACKREDEKPELNYYLGDLKQTKQRPQQTQQPQNVPVGTIRFQV